MQRAAFLRVQNQLRQVGEELGEDLTGLLTIKRQQDTRWMSVMNAVYSVWLELAAIMLHVHTASAQHKDSDADALFDKLTNVEVP